MKDGLQKCPNDTVCLVCRFMSLNGLTDDDLYGTMFVIQINDRKIDVRKDRHPVIPEFDDIPFFKIPGIMVGNKSTGKSHVPSQSISDNNKNKNKNSRFTTMNDIDKKLYKGVMDVPDYIINDFTKFDQAMYYRYGNMYAYIRDKIPAEMKKLNNKHAYIYNRALEIAGVPPDFINQMSIASNELSALVDTLISIEAYKQEEKLK